MTKKAYTIQENGQVTLPTEWREKYGLKKGDTVFYRETEEGLLISPKEAQVMNLLDEIGQALNAKGISLEELIEDGRTIRAELIQEHYGQDKAER